MPAPLVSQPYMNSQQAAEYLGIHIVTVYRMLKKKDIPAKRIGGQWRFKQDELDQYFSTMK